MGRAIRDVSVREELLYGGPLMIVSRPAFDEWLAHCEGHILLVDFCLRGTVFRKAVIAGVTP